MAWNKTNTANSVPVEAAANFKLSPNTASRDAVFKNPTGGIFQADGGWVLRKVGTGGRAGRVTNEILQAMGSIKSTGVTPATVLNATSSTTGFSVVSAATLATKSYPAAHPNGATTGLSIKCLAADTFVGARTTTVPANFRLTDVEVVGMWVYWAATNGSVSLRFTSDNFVGKNKTFSWAYSGQLHNGWNLLTIRPNDTGTTSPNNSTWTVAGGFADTDTVNGIEIQLATNGAVDTEIYVGGVFYYKNVPTKGAIQIGFDAFGEASIPQYALPILSAAGIEGYWAGDGNLIVGGALDKLNTVYAAGWDVISQGMNHLNYTGQTAQKLSDDYDAAKAIFLANGFTRGQNDLWSYPLSSNNDTTDGVLIGKGVKLARSGWGWWIHQNEFNNGPKLIGHGAVNMGSKTLTQIKALVDAAVRYGVTINLFTHGLTPGGNGGTPPADPLFWYVNDYQELVNYMVKYRAQGLLDIDSPTQWLAKRS